MTHDELARRLAKESDLWIYQARAALAGLTKIIEDEVNAGNSVRLKEFGVFEAQDYSQRTARNPGTGEAVIVPARRKLVFRPSRRLWNLEKNENNEERDAC